MLRNLSLFIFALIFITCAGLQTGTQTDAGTVVQTYEKTWNAQLTQAQELFKQLESYEGPQTVESILVPYDELQIITFGGLTTANLQSNVHPDPAMRTSAEAAMQAFSNLLTDIGLSRPIYEAVAGVDVSGEPTDTRRFVELILQEYRRSGVDKDDATRARIRQLNEDLVGIGQEFGRNIRDDVRSITLTSVEELDGLPEDYIDSHQPGEDGTIIINTDYPEYYPFMTYAHSDARRKELYRARLQRATPQNLEVLDQLIAKRHELATLLGYATWADYITENKMVKTADAVQAFVDQLTEAGKPALERDYAILLERLQQIDPSATSIGIWQRYYLPELIQREKFNYDSQETRQYLAYDKVRDGLLSLTGQLFGVTYKRLDDPAWHPDVEVYELWSGSDLLGKFYLDMHSREGKYKHAAQFTVLPGVAGKQLPEAALVCNFPGGLSDPSGLMGHNQVQTFFHEFGHLLHEIFSSQHRWSGLAGIAEYDFVEVPSTIFEEWAWDLTTLQTFATNAQGEVIPEALVEKMRASRMFAQAIWTQRQVALSAISLDLYNRDPQGLNTTELIAEIQDKYNPYTYMDGTCIQCSFGHLDDYSAVYYTYMWSTVIAVDMFSEFEKAGLLNPEVSQRFRKAVLEPGSSKGGTEMVRDFLGRDYSFEAFEKWLSGE
jgi:thimet oligopeptidase